MKQVPTPISNDTQIEILHDHYKESFARVVSVERSRDRLFLLVILLYALLAVEVGYPASFEGAVGAISVAGVQVNLDALPLPALLNATWVLVFAVLLDYCRKAVWVSRQYRYIHSLEAIISPKLDAGDAYHREGTFYADDYPVLLNVAWIAYVFIFPIILAVATAGLIYWEWRALPYHWSHRAFDVAVATSLLMVCLLYQVLPNILHKIRQRREQSRRQDTQRPATHRPTRKRRRGQRG